MHKINSKPINSFHASISEFSYRPMQIDMKYQETLRPVLLKQEFKPKKYNLVLDFVSQLDISRFMAEVIHSFKLDIDDGFLYECFFSGVDVQQEGVHSFTLTLSLLVIQKRMERRIRLTKKENNVVISGTYRCGIRYEITPHYNGEIFVGGYTVKNIHAGKCIILDGENMLITEDGKNKYSDAMFTKFPSLEPGNHKIIISNTNADIMMCYSPVYF